MDRKMTDLYLRKVTGHPQATNNYRVILKDHGEEIELGSIGVQTTMGATGGGWRWGIDTVVPMRDFESSGSGIDRADCMKKFKAAWERFASDPAQLVEFIAEKRRIRRR
jgi:hypothetical protein